MTMGDQAEGSPEETGEISDDAESSADIAEAAGESAAGAGRRESAEENEQARESRDSRLEMTLQEAAIIAQNLKESGTRR